MRVEQLVSQMRITREYVDGGIETTRPDEMGGLDEQLEDDQQRR